jgi:hypothetical protein
MQQVVGAVIIPFETNLNLRIEKALMRRPRPLAWSATNPANTTADYWTRNDALVTPIKRNTWRTA